MLSIIVKGKKKKKNKLINQIGVLMDPSNKSVRPKITIFVNLRLSLVSN